MILTTVSLVQGLTVDSSTSSMVLELCQCDTIALNIDRFDIFIESVQLWYV